MRRRSQLAMVLPLFVLALPAALWAADKKLPPFELCEQKVREHFKPSFTYQPADLLTRSDVKPVFAVLADAGWQMDDPNAILDRVLADDDFLVRQLNSPKGRQLYDRVAKHPGALDRLDRMREMRGGTKTLEVFVQKTRGNADVLTTMLTTKRGRRFANDIAKFENGKNFNKPTERIYRLAELIPALREAYDRQLAEQQRKP